MVDKLTAMMMVVVTFVSLLVHVYTIGYMAEDDGYQRFFSYISLFTFSMLMLVMSNNFLQLFFGWEAVGLVSYLLIGFWFKAAQRDLRQPQGVPGQPRRRLRLPARHRRRAVLDRHAGLRHRFANAPTIRDATVTIIGAATNGRSRRLICVCLFIGAMGKSAQVPLHVWLPDSMEGPTPISALIHAATMVTAGIFMVARMSPLFEMSPDRAGLRPVHRRHHRVLHRPDRHRAERHQARVAYSPVAARLHDRGAGRVRLLGGGLPPDDPCLLQALLFLGAGSVIIGMHHEQDMRKMGGLRKVHADHPLTMWIGTLALVGTPFFSGFYRRTPSSRRSASMRTSTWLGRDSTRTGRCCWARSSPVLQLPPAVPDLLRRRTLPPRAGMTTRTTATRMHAHDDHHDAHHDDHGHGARAAQIAVGGDPAAGAAGDPVGSWSASHRRPDVVRHRHAGPPRSSCRSSSARSRCRKENDVVAKLAEEFHGRSSSPLHGFSAPAFFLALMRLPAGPCLYVVKRTWRRGIARIFALAGSVLRTSTGWTTCGSAVSPAASPGQASRGCSTSKVIDGVAVNGSARLGRPVRRPAAARSPATLPLRFLRHDPRPVACWPRSRSTPGVTDTTDGYRIAMHWPLLSILVWLPILGGVISP